MNPERMDLVVGPCGQVFFGGLEIWTFVPERVLTRPQNSLKIQTPEQYSQPWTERLFRYQQSGDNHFQPFNWTLRLPYPASPEARDLFKDALERNW